MSQLPTSPGGKRKPTLKLALETVNEVSNDQTEVSESAMKSPKPYGGFDMTMPTPRTAVPRPPKTPRIIDEGVKKFRHFDTKMNGLDSELLRFANNVRPLGSSVNLIRSSYALRKSLHQIRHLFRVNASEIFPAFVENEEPTSLEPIVLRKRYRAMRDPLNLVKVPNRMVESKKGLAPDLERFPRQLGKLAQEMISFLHFLHDIPEFTDETLTHRIHAAHADVKYWEFSFSEHKGKFQTAAVQRQVNNLCNELQGHIENMTEALKAFQKDGINYIKSAQTQAQTGFQNLSTIATFFSAMTATTLQAILLAREVGF
ncbi:hypothetical protein FRC03_003677 [Tulasnella sp. 419]|nr:hypothetical protein FRC03_003677 [Tulasnella sp. 419]